MKQKPALLIVEDQYFLRIGLRLALESSGCCSVVGEAADGLLAVREALRLSPEVILMDIGLPGIDGIEATWRIKNDLPSTRVIMFTSTAEPDSVSAAFGAGADGYCVKEASVEQIISAIETVARGEFYLDPVIADCVVRNQKAVNALSVKLSDDEMQINKFVVKRVLTKNSEHKERVQLNQWLTAFVDNIDEDTIFNEKYLILSLIGEGGCGAVFKAKQLYIDRTVAVKILHPELIEDKLLFRGFQREATAVANLHHRNLVAVYDFDISENRQPYLVMEYVDGRDLSAIISKEGRLEPIRALKLFTQVCDGLSSAHEHGIVHCDLKPSNILVTASEEYELVKLVDFGLVQMLPKDSSSQLKLTERHMVSGTPMYMSPEQCLGKSMDERSDIYALGCVFFETLTGRPVFEANTAIEVFSQQLKSQAPLMQSVCPQADFGDDLEALVARMLAKEPSERPQSMKEVKVFIFQAAMAIQESSKSPSLNAMR